MPPYFTIAASFVVSLKLGARGSVVILPLPCSNASYFLHSLSCFSCVSCHPCSSFLRFYLFSPRYSPLPSFRCSVSLPFLGVPSVNPRRYTREISVSYLLSCVCSRKSTLSICRFFPTKEQRGRMKTKKTEDRRPKTVAPRRTC